MNIFILVIFFVWGYTKGDGGGNWGYQSGKSFRSPDQWNTLPGTSCGGVRQSPVDIIKKNSQFWLGLKPVTVSTGQSTANVILKTSGTSILLSFSDSWKITFSGMGCLKPVAIHWHWGSKDTQGSEHKFDSNQFPLEGHLVTYNCGLYSDATNATLYPSGLYVFSILYNIGGTNIAIDKFLPYIDTVIKNGTATLLEISPSEFLPTNLGSYYRYEGSLTFPPCTENVIWTVFNDLQTISSTQLSKFRTLQFVNPQDGPMVDNFRPVIALGSSSDYINRIIYSSINSARSMIVKWALFPIFTLLVALLAN